MKQFWWFAGYLLYWRIHCFRTKEYEFDQISNQTSSVPTTDNFTCPHPVWWCMSHSNLDSSPSKLLASQTPTVGWLAWLAAWLRIGNGLIQQIRKLKNKQRDGKIVGNYWVREVICGPSRAEIRDKWELRSACIGSRDFARSRSRHSSRTFPVSDFHSAATAKLL